MNINTILLQAEGAGGMGQYSTLILMGGFVIILYFFMIRPQQKKQKEARKFQEEIGKGDSVVTIGGIHGKIVETNDTTLVIDIDRGTKLTVERTAVSAENTKKAQGS